MRRLFVWVAGCAAVLIAVPILAIAIALLAANTDPGRRLIEHSVAQLSGGTVRIEGLSGRFPDNLHIARIDLADPAGPYGAKGVAEPATIPTTPAILNAIYDAVGVRVMETPATPERIYHLLREKEVTQG